MARRVKQFRYYGDSDGNRSKNAPAASLGEYVNGSIFASYYPIIQLGIQAMPGTKFALNISDTPIIIGSTGIYELDLNGQTEITSLSFLEDSMKKIAELNNAILIVDIVYDDGDVEV